MAELTADCDLDCAGILLAAVKPDRVQLQQVLLNLIMMK
jgi:signal transduction histidine kinase